MGSLSKELQRLGSLATAGKVLPSGMSGAKGCG